MGSELPAAAPTPCGGQPGAYTYLIWGYRQNYRWNELGHVDLAGPSSSGYSFDIHRLANQWHYVFDNVERWPQVVWGVNGAFVDAGVESGNLATVVPNHWFSEMQRTFGEGPWYYWGEVPSQQVDQSMCGFYRTGVQWSGGQNATCY